MNAALYRFFRFAQRVLVGVAMCNPHWAQQSEMARLLRIAAGLPDDTRRVVTLYKVYGFTPPAIAARLALSRAAVHHHLVRAALALSAHSARAPTAWGHTQEADSAAHESGASE